LKYFQENSAARPAWVIREGRREGWDRFRPLRVREAGDQR
jgi:hypothetical protein